MLHAGLDLSRKKIDMCLLSQAGEIVDEWASPPDADVCAAWRDAPACTRPGCAG
jgi:hypothetical protein